MEVRCLFLGDMHLGRRPKRLPKFDEIHNLDPADLSPSAAWRAAVDRAVQHEVSAVCLAGDVVDAENSRYGALGPLKAGVERLANHGISVFAVAGNHDAESLPRLSRVVPSLRLLGRGGRWEAVEVSDPTGRPCVRLLGWSFPASRVTTSPFAAAEFPAFDDGVPTLGVLHADLEDPQSHHAPVSQADLDRVPTAGWFLGHIHKPSALERGRPSGYLGSLLGLDPTETGARGPWLVSLRGTALRAEHIPLAPLRWELSDVPIDPTTSPDDILALAHEAIVRVHRDLRESAPSNLKAVGLRLRFVGRSRRHRELAAAIRDDRLREMQEAMGDTVYFIDKTYAEIRPAVDLDTLARSNVPSGILARTLLALERGGDEAQRVLDDARKDLDDGTWQRPEWGGLDAEALTDDALRRYLLEAGYSALDELLSQVDGSDRERGNRSTTSESTVEAGGRTAAKPTADRIRDEVLT